MKGHYSGAGQKNNDELEKMKTLVSAEIESLQLANEALAEISVARVAAIIDAKKAKESYEILDQGQAKQLRNAGIKVVIERYELNKHQIGKKKDYVKEVHKKVVDRIKNGETGNLPSIELALPPGSID